MLDFTLPELGENIESGDVVNVLVKEGDLISDNDGVIRLETDKAVIDCPAPMLDAPPKIHMQKGQSVKVGQPMLSIESEDGAIKPQPAVALKTPGVGRSCIDFWDFRVFRSANDGPLQPLQARIVRPNSRRIPGGQVSD
jgi:pyruvate/2-oxoglutarate dehydrogenase complex dihydrolipoamide acyltransferase (E2) component